MIRDQIPYSHSYVRIRRSIHSVVTRGTMVGEKTYYVRAIGIEYLIDQNRLWQSDRHYGELEPLSRLQQEHTATKYRSKNDDFKLCT